MRLDNRAQWSDSYRWNLTRGNTEGRELVVETHFARHVRTLSLTDDERQIVIGSLLGDGSLTPTTCGCSFRVHHGLQQRIYVEWKFKMLSRFVRTSPRVSGNGCYFRTVSHPEFAQLRRWFYPLGRKVVPFALLAGELRALGLAVWIMDDGSLDGKQLRLNTQCFSEAENRNLVGLLRAKFGISVSLNSDKGRVRLRCNAASVARLVSLVRPHFIPSMLYKLPP